eukprot:3933897-Rhodomonas_salina.2
MRDAVSDGCQQRACSLAGSRQHMCKVELEYALWMGCDMGLLFLFLVLYVDAAAAVAASGDCESMGGAGYCLRWAQQPTLLPSPRSAVAHPEIKHKKKQSFSELFVPWVRLLVLDFAVCCLRRWM